MRHFIPVTPDLTLTPFVPDDAKTLIRHLQDQTIYQNTLRIPHPYTKADAQWWLDHVAVLQVQYNAPSQWAIRHHVHGHIGNIGMFYHGGKESHYDEIGYWLAAPYRGHGLMTAAVKALCIEMFAQRPQLVRIEAAVFSDNPASIRVLEKAGFECEGYLRNRYFKDGAHLDAVMLAKIRTGAYRVNA
jgi:[ribosomal protein S5]-alanine N-acetyltransferase